MANGKRSGSLSPIISTTDLCHKSRAMMEALVAMAFRKTYVVSQDIGFNKQALLKEGQPSVSYLRASFASRSVVSFGSLWARGSLRKKAKRTKSWNSCGLYGKVYLISNRNARSAGLSVPSMCFITLIPVKLVSKIAFGFTFTYANRECYFTTPATSVRGGGRG